MKDGSTSGQGERGNCVADSVTDRLAGWLAGWLIDKLTGRTRREGSQLHATASRHRCGSEVHQRPG